MYCGRCINEQPPFKKHHYQKNKKMGKTKKVRFRKITVGRGKKLSTNYNKIKERLTEGPELQRVISLEQKRRAILNNRSLDPESRILLYRQVVPKYDAAYAKYRDSQSLELEDDDATPEVGTPPQRKTPKQIIKSILKTPASTPATTPKRHPAGRSRIPVATTTGTPILSAAGKSLTPSPPRKIDLSKEVEKTGQKHWLRKPTKRLSSRFSTPRGKRKQ